MTVQTINIQLPAAIYQRLRRRADAMNRPLAETQPGTDPVIEELQRVMGER